MVLAADSSGPYTSPRSRRAGVSAGPVRSRTTSTAQASRSATAVERLGAPGSGCSSRPRRLSRSGVRIAMSVPPVVRDEDLAQRLELLHAATRAQGDAGQGGVGDVDGHARLVAEPLVEAGEQGSPAGEHDAAVHDVAGELRG